MTAEGAGGGPPEARVRHRRRRVALLVAGGVLLAALLAASLVQLPDDAIVPGTARSVPPLISVPRADASTHRGSVLLTDVDIVSLRAIDWPFYRLNRDDEIVSTGELEGPLTSSQYDAQGVVDMATAQQAATYVALHALGYPVTAVASGVVDYQPEPGSPASRSLSIGDVITAIDGRATATIAALSNVLGSFGPGARVAVTLHPVTAARRRTVTMTLGQVDGVKGDAGKDERCLTLGASTALAPVLRDGRRMACLGIYVEQIYATAHEPFPVTMSSLGIIGPSAGLAFTLGLMDKLDRADLTGGAKVAATGTMSIDGDVGDVGGVAQKTVAVSRAGATLFLVPPQELAVARAHAGTRLHVVAVSSLAQALAALRAIGGRVVTSRAP